MNLVKTKQHFWDARPAHKVGSKRRGGEIVFNLDQQGTEMPVYRQAIFRLVSVLLTVLLLPAVALTMLTQDYVSAAGLTVIMMPMIWHCWRLFLRNRSGLPPLLVMGACTLVLLLTIYYQYPANIYWAPALLVLLHFVLPRNSAIILSVLCYGLAAPAIVETLPPQQAFIMLLSMAVLGAGTSIFSQLVSRQDLLLQKVAVQDPLTLVYNRRYLMESLEQTFELHKRYQKVASMIMLDIDYFKRINDEFGHGEGDRVLKEFVRLLQRRLRRTDSLFRYGGEEFVILLSETDSAQAYQLAQEFCSLVRNANILPEAVLTVSCGVAELSSGENSLGWLARCDEALYRAKHAGRDRAELAGTNY